jgi:hypothetical protein
MVLNIECTPIDVPIIIIIGSTALRGLWTASSDFAINQFSGLACQPYANPSYPEGSMFLSLFFPLADRPHFKAPGNSLSAPA